MHTLTRLTAGAPRSVIALRRSRYGGPTRRLDEPGPVRPQLALLDVRLTHVNTVRVVTELLKVSSGTYVVALADEPDEDQELAFDRASWCAPYVHSTRPPTCSHAS